MSAMHHKDELSGIWLFSGCSARERKTLRRAFQEVSVPAGKVLTEEGAIGREFFLILEGTASVRHHDRTLTTLGPYQYFGELSLLDRGPRTATVVADTDMRVLVLSQREFNGILETVPTMTRKLLGIMAGRLRDSDARAFH